MRPVFTAAEMRAVDARAIEALGIPGARLMDRAGTGAAELIARHFAPIRGRRVAIVCGKGNNGGDGFVVARRLRARGARIDVVLAARRDEVKGDAAGALAQWRGPVRELAPSFDPAVLAHELARADVVVDGLLGTGLAGAARGESALAIDAINAAGRPVVALDLPSGISSDTGRLMGPTVQARLTATFAGYKRGLVDYPAAAYAGQVHVVDLGIPPDDVARGMTTFLLDEEDVRPHFPPRRRDAHKGSYGHVLVVAGSVGKTGAAALAGRAALRSGVGLCTIASPASQQPIVAALGMEHMTEPLAETPGQALSLKARDRVLELVERVDAVALGPGLSQDPDTQELVRALVLEVGRPTVVDADGLNALAGDLTVLARAAGPRVLTPHPGEMARLLGVPIAEIQQDRIETARRFAASHRVHVALKGARTVIAAPDGRVFVNPTGNPGMASGGSGDVLTGMAGAFLARGLDPLAAIQSGCFLHGRAGDLAAAAHGEDGLLASDILEAIPAAIQSLRGSHSG